MPCFPEAGTVRSNTPCIGQAHVAFEAWTIQPMNENAEESEIAWYKGNSGMRIL
jgi:hypothetical protein